MTNSKKYYFIFNQIYWTSLDSVLVKIANFKNLFY